MAYTLTETPPQVNNRFFHQENRTVHVGILCDGMGGEGRGDICSNQAVQAFGNAFAEAGSFNTLWVQRLLMAAYAANGAICDFKTCANLAHTSAGATFAAAVIADNHLHFASAGDTAILLFRRNGETFTMQCLNSLHSTWWRDEIDKQGNQQAVLLDLNDPEQRERAIPGQCYSRLTSALLGREIGTPRLAQAGIPAIDTSEACLKRMGIPEARQAEGFPLQVGDIIVICTDGVINALEFDTEKGQGLIDTIRNYGAPAITANQIAKSIIDLINDKPAENQDNASCIVFKVHEPGN